MANEYKKIVLLKGLEHINNYYFSIIKSLLAHDLKLTRKMQHESNRIQIADLMEKVFRYDAGVDKLIALIKNITPLKHLVKKLRAEKLKVVKKMKSISAKGKTPLERIQQTEVGPASPASTLSSSRTSEGVEGVPVAQKRKMTTTEKTGNKRNKVSEEQTSPLYAATTSKFTTMDHCPPSQTLSSTPSNNSSTTTIKCITTPIYDFKRMNPSKEQCQPPQTAAIRERPSKFYPQSSQASLQTPPSHSLRETGTRLTPRYGLERPIPSQEQGQPLRTAATPARPSEFHPQTSLVPPQTSPSRFLSQTGIRTTSIYDVERLNPPREQNPAPQTAATPARPSESHLHTPWVPPQTPLSPFLSQNIKDALQTYNYKRMKSPWQLNQLLQTSDKRTPPTVSHSQIPPMPPQTPPHSSLNKKTGKLLPEMYASRRMNSSQKQKNTPSSSGSFSNRRSNNHGLSSHSSDTSMNDAQQFLKQGPQEGNQKATSQSLFKYENFTGNLLLRIWMLLIMMFMELWKKNMHLYTDKIWQYVYKLSILKVLGGFFILFFIFFLYFLNVLVGV